MKLLLEFPNVSKAYQLALAAHKGQVDKGGKPYINHPVMVAKSVCTEAEQTVALLHDIIEDTDMTLDDLRAEGFSEQVIEAVDCITKRNKEPLNQYLHRVKGNCLATSVKLADLAHNSDLSRISHPTETDYARTERYKKAIVFLLEQ